MALVRKYAPRGPGGFVIGLELSNCKPLCTFGSRSRPILRHIRRYEEERLDFHWWHAGGASVLQEVATTIT